MIPYLHDPLNYLLAPDQSVEMDEQSARNLALLLMDEFDLLPEWQFRWDNAKKRFGRCNYRKKVIQLSRPLTGINPPEQVEDTIRHEIAHAKDAEERGRSDHSTHWKRWAVRCGARPIRCFSAADVVTPEAPFYTYCPNCSNFTPRYRRIRQGRLYACGRCSRGFNPNYAVIPNIPLCEKNKLEAGHLSWYDLAQASDTAELLEKLGSPTLYLRRYRNREEY